MNKNIKYFVAGLIAIGAVIVVMNMQQSDDLSLFKREFMTGCTESDDSKTQKAFCSCTFESMLKRYGKRGLIEVAKEYNETGVLSDESFDLALTCAYEQ